MVKREMAMVWSDYLRYRAVQRGFDLARIEEVVRYSDERYIDNATGRLVAVGRHARCLIMVPYEIVEGEIRPVTVHATSRTQIAARIQSGRFDHE